jgi:hypothetical protein
VGFRKYIDHYSGVYDVSNVFINYCQTGNCLSCYIGTSGKHSAYAFLGCFVSQCPTNCAFILIDVNGALQIAHAVPIFDSVRSFRPSFPPPPFPSASFLAWFLSRDICDLSPFPPPIFTDIPAKPL